MKVTIGRVVCLAGGLVGLAFTAVGGLSLLPFSILLGASVGLVLVGIFSDVVLWHKRTLTPEENAVLDRLLSPAPVTRPVKDAPVDPSTRAERRRTLDNFDKMLPSLSKARDSEASVSVTREFSDAMDNLNRLYPEWDGEGRLRTYVVLKAVARLIDNKSVDPYLDIAYKTLQLRNSEAAEVSRTLLKDKLEKMYVDPKFDNASHLTGTLILMNTDQIDRVNEIVMDAIHLWNAAKFKKMKPELAMVNKLAQTEKSSVVETLEKEMTKAKRANDPATLRRARDILRMMDFPAVEPDKGQIVQP